jgi:hypothetical protein
MHCDAGDYDLTTCGLGVNYSFTGTICCKRDWYIREIIFRKEKWSKLPINQKPEQEVEIKLQ